MEWIVNKIKETVSPLFNTDYTPQFKVIVKNLPDNWTPEQLEDFLKAKVRSLKLKKDAVQTFSGFSNTALLLLEDGLPDNWFDEASQHIKSVPFKEHILELEKTFKPSEGVLVKHNFNEDHGTEQEMHNRAERELRAYFEDTSKNFWVRTTWVDDCDISSYFKIGYAIVIVKCKDSNTSEDEQQIQKCANPHILSIEPWHEEFHRPLLEQILMLASNEDIPKVTESGDYDTHDISTLLNEIEMNKALLIKTECEIQNLQTVLKTSESDNSRTLSLIEKITEEHEKARDDFQMTQERLLVKNAELKATIEEMKVREAERLDNAKREAMERMERQAQMLQKQFSEQSKVEEKFMDVPENKLRLLTDFATTWEGCQIMLLQNDEKVLLFGTEKECKRAKMELLKLMQSMADESLLVDESVITILRTEKGEQYLTDIMWKHPKCSVTFDSASIQCAALDKADLQPLISFLSKAFVKKICKVPSSLTQEAKFKVFKGKLEETNLVRIILPEDGVDDVVIHGVADDTEIVAREIDTFTSLNIPGRKEFCITGPLAGKACKKWFSTALDEAKQLIIKNGKVIKEETEDGYQLMFECRQEVLQLVLLKLNDIKYGIVSTSVDLNKAFEKYCDRALVVNGLHSYGKETFVSLLLHKLKQEGISCLLDIVLPQEHVLPEFGIQLKGLSRRQSVNPIKQYQPTSRRPSNASAVQSVYVKEGDCKITIRSENLARSEMQAAVNVVGKDLNMKDTTLGKAFLEVFPELQQELKSQNVADNTGRTQGFQLFVSRLSTKPLVMHVIFQKMENIEKEVVCMVTEILKETEQRKIASISMTPLGVGRKFKFDTLKTATSMVTAMKSFLHGGSKYVKEIVIAITEPDVAAAFTSTLAQVMGPVISLSHNDQSKDTKQEETKPDKGKIRTETARERFDALICTAKDNTTKDEIIIQTLIKEMDVTFLWHEIQHDTDTFEKLDDDTKQEIKDFADRKNIAVTKLETGLRLCGRKELVQTLHSLIRKKMYEFVVEKSREGWARRQELGLPVDTDHLPSYWRDSKCNYDTAVQKWNEKGTHSLDITDEEREAVEKVFLATWTLDGLKIDSRGMKPHTVKVVKVERLENPIMWRAYSSKRELLFNDLVARHTGTGTARCTPVEDISSSRGPVMTTNNIDKNGPLDREIYHQINEHYFFHGTSHAVINKIFSQGLDFRLANSGFFGRGVYGAETPTKSNQYVDSSQPECVMFLMRMVLGEPYLTLEDQPKMLQEVSRPPCMTCHNTKCLCKESRLYNSILYNNPSDKTARGVFREFIVYDQDVCYPEYLITYRRIYI